ncbi:MAG: hypothetical protein JSV01_11265 [Desulfobacterales bacterium]|nr:MAG: hypothetical protein JSV01_11265 [Desulfobacterales bacterium]
MSKSLHFQLDNLAEVFINFDAVRQLVREELGCACPDGIFEEVTVGCPSIFGSPNVPSSVQILVGHRLLVSLVPVRDLKNVAEEAKHLLLNGRDIRDRHALNRYRLVLVGRVSKSVLTELEKEAANLDDRMHVHLVESDRSIGNPATREPI